MLPRLPIQVLLAGSTCLMPVLASFLRVRSAATTLSDVPECNATIQGCACPEGTFYQSSTSYAVFHADAADLTRLISNFTDTAWFGTTPTAISGTAEHPIRLLVAEVDGVAVPTSEELTVFTDYSGQSDPSETTAFPEGFFLQFEAVDTPIELDGESGPGVIAGTWDTMDVRKIADGETLWVWSIYTCFSFVYPFNGFHESAMSNVSSLLDAEGKLSAPTLGPFSL